jgi:protoheme IX farnesyltransferase
MTIENAEFSSVTLAPGGQGTASDYFALLKPRVMSLVVFTAIVGLFAAPGHIHPWIGFITILCIALGAGASGALNMWYDADIDAVMKRTANRPVPRGAIEPGEALGFGMALAIGSVVMMGLLVNWQSAALLAFTIFFYVAVYTIGLKRFTPQNIVIGGAAGAFPPMVAWVAVTQSVDLGSIALFLLIFMWTPPHFWALALFREGDYDKANIPMLPNVAGRPETRKQILIYSLLMLPTVALPVFTGTAGLLYASGAGLLTLVFLKGAWDVYVAAEGLESDKACKHLFFFSIYWLFAVFGLILVERLLQLPVLM